MTSVFRDGLSHAMQIAYQQPSDFVAKVTAMIQFSDWSERLDVPTFRRLLSLVTLDRFVASGTDDERAERMAPLYRSDIETVDGPNGKELSPETIQKVKAHIRKLRKHDCYQELYDQVNSQARALSGAKTMDEAARVLEPVAVETAAEAMLFSPKLEDRAAAAREFSDRRSAKKSRDDQAARDKMLPENFVEAMMLGARVTAELLKGQQGPVIDAEVLNVPALPAAPRDADP